jgi:hypothetical protein
MKKMQLAEEITEFLLQTPDACHSSDQSWTNPLALSIAELIKNRLPSDKRRILFRLISSLTHGFGRIDWFRNTQENTWTESDRKLFGLLSRLACVEIVMCIEAEPLDSELMGSLLIILEHCLSCLVDEESSVASGMEPDALASLIKNIREVAASLIDYLSEKWTGEESTLESLEYLSMLRFICQWIIEDTCLNEEQAESLRPLIVSVLEMQMEKHLLDSPSFEHALLSSLLSLFDVKEFSLESLQIESFVNNCNLCSNQESTCQKVKQIISNK